MDCAREASGRPGADQLQKELPEPTISEEDGVRYLHLGTRWIQGAMRLARPDAVELEYVQRMLAALLWRPSAKLSSGHAVQLGLGAATLTRFTRRVLRMRTTAVEINPAVVGACKAWFRLPQDDPRLALVVGDAMQWVGDPVNAATTHLLHVDLYDEEAAAPVLDDETFYAGCRAVLAEGGVMSVNLFGRNASFERSVERIGSAFAGERLWRMKATREGNTIVIAARGVELPERDELERRADTIETRLRLPARKWLRMLAPLE